MPRQELPLPKFGMQMIEGTISAWLVADGTSVRQGEAIVTIETDKADADVEAPVTGTITILVGEGETIEVGTVIAVFES
jgi:pyruvate/2-oxoglutarate dehydrogenase complex dihydrolipoamide acyltransferase (E2) component